MPVHVSDARRLAAAVADRITIVIVGRGTAGELREYSEAYGLRNVVVDSDREVFQAYRTTTTPSA